MLGIAAKRGVGVAARPAVGLMRCSTEASQRNIKINLCLPHSTIYADKEVYMVVLPGVEGAYAVRPRLAPLAAQLAPGLLKIFHEQGKPAEKFFITAGLAFTNKAATTYITAADAVKVDEIDRDMVTEQFKEFEKKVNQSTRGSREYAEARIGLDTCTAMRNAIGV